jgi:hypothetical protein
MLVTYVLIIIVKSFSNLKLTTQKRGHFVIPSRELLMSTILKMFTDTLSRAEAI